MSTREELLLDIAHCFALVPQELFNYGEILAVKNKLENCEDVKQEVKVDCLDILTPKLTALPREWEGNYADALQDMVVILFVIFQAVHFNDIAYIQVA